MIKNTPQEPDNKQIELILALFKTRKFEEAKNTINKLTIKFPNSSILYNIFGAILVEENQLVLSNNMKSQLDLNQIIQRHIIIWV